VALKELEVLALSLRRLLRMWCGEGRSLWLLCDSTGKTFYILDEPTNGLDPNQIIEIRNVIKEIGKEKTIILSTHIMQEVEALCSRVILIHKGNILQDTSI